MNFGLMASILIAIVAVLGVFVEIPIVSDHAFWVMAGAYLVLLGFTGDLRRKKWNKWRSNAAALEVRTGESWTHTPASRIFFDPSRTSD
jgi:hypothetical protein